MAQVAAIKESLPSAGWKDWGRGQRACSCFYYEMCLAFFRPASCCSRCAQFNIELGMNFLSFFLCRSQFQFASIGIRAAPDHAHASPQPSRPRFLHNCKRFVSTPYFTDCQGFGWMRIKIQHNITCLTHGRAVQAGRPWHACGLCGS